MAFVSAVQVLRAWLVAAGSPVLGLVAAGDVRADQLPEGHPGTRAAVVLVRSAGGPALDVEVDEAVVSLRIYGTGSRVSCDAVAAAVAARLHKVYGEQAGTAGWIVSCEVDSMSDSVDEDFEEPVAMCVMMVSVRTKG